MAKLKKVLLLNPPADGIYFRDLYHTFSSKAAYVWQPADLLILSGALGRHFHITIRDCIGDGLSVPELVTSLEDHSRFDFIISLISSITLPSDVETLEALQQKYPEAKYLVVGDFVREKGSDFLRKYDMVDGCLLDFTADDLEDVLLQWNDIKEARPNYILRKGGRLLVGNLQRTLTPIKLLIPHHEKFELSNYAQPINRNLPVATVLGAVGCPFRCGFCAQSSIAFRARAPKDIVEEIRFLWELGVREVMFRDQLMEGNKRNLKELCQLLIDSGIQMSWYCNSRADTLNRDLIQLMHSAGCHSVLMGIESADDDVLERLQTGKSGEQTQSTIFLLREVGIAVLGYFILGLPGETRLSIEKTIKYACSLDIDLASFATPSPDYGTTIREDAVEQGLIDQSMIANTDRSVEISKLSDGVTPTQLTSFRRKAYRAFYLRPLTVLRIAAFVSAKPQLIRNIWRNFIAMLSKQLLAGFPKPS